MLIRSGKCSCECQSTNSERCSGRTFHHIATAALPKSDIRSSALLQQRNGELGAHNLTSLAEIGRGRRRHWDDAKKNCGLLGWRQGLLICDCAADAYIASDRDHPRYHG